MKNIKSTVLFTLFLAATAFAQTPDGGFGMADGNRRRPQTSIENNRVFFGDGPISPPQSQTLFDRLNSVIQPENAKKDIDVWFDWLHTMHPDVSYTVKDIDKFYAAVAQIKNGIDAPLTVLEFWRRISVLNSQLSDGHLVVGNPGADYLNDYVAKGGTLFPFEVVFNDAELVITQELGGKPSELNGYSISKINNVPIETVRNELLLRIHGDSDNHRKALLQKRFAYFYRLVYGESKQFTLTVIKNKRAKDVSVQSVNTLPFVYKTVNSFADNFQFRLLDDKNALLTINTFGWDKKEDYFEFTKAAFASLKKNNIRHLIVDVRENSGGDDDLWTQGILKYIAKKPYKWGSKYRKRILAKYRDEGQVIGSVVEAEIETPIPVDPETENRFEGKVSVLIGHYTYSSAILFANTVQDNGFGKLVGEATGGKSGQSGGIQFLTLPNSGLRMVCPRFILERPAGGRMKEPVKPDIEIGYDKTAPAELVNKLLALPSK
jgi:C-terminal processing protease CtpA/Prc